MCAFGFGLVQAVGDSLDVLGPASATIAAFVALCRGWTIAACGGDFACGEPHMLREAVGARFIDHICA